MPRRTRRTPPRCMLLKGMLLKGMLLLWLATASAHAQVAGDEAPPVFRDRVEEQRFHALTTELRCVMCQNQSLADSNAQIARDLRREILQLMREGRSDGDIERFLVQRYGEFVLYKPPVEPRNWLLWFGPGIVLLLGGMAVWRLVRASGRVSPSTSARPASTPPDGREWW